MAGFVLVGGMVGAGLAGYVQFFPEKVARGVVETWRRNARLLVKELTLSDGLKYVYLEGGEGEPLLLLHGFGADKDNFAPVSQYLARRFRLIIPDHIGFGESSKPENADYSPTAQVERLRRLVGALKLGRIHVGGSSMGGQIALTYAALHTNEVASLWLLDPAGVWSATKSEMFRGIEAGGRNPMLVRNEDEFLLLFRKVMAKPPPVPSSVLRVMARARIQNLALEERIFPVLIADSIEERARGLRVPTLIVWGQEDWSLHVDGAGILNRLMPQSEKVIMEGIGHLPMVEAPQRAADDYLRFRERLAAQGGRRETTTR